MSEAIIRRFRGFATNLPDLNNGAFAEDVLNVYEKTPGELVRREGCRRAIEYVADGPITMIRSIVEPGGEYTGSGMDLLLQAGSDIVGESSPRSTIVPVDPDTPGGEAPVDYSPHIESVHVVATQTEFINTVVVVGRNFDFEASNPAVVTGTNITRLEAGFPGKTAVSGGIEYISPTKIKFLWVGVSVTDIFSMKIGRAHV